MGILDFLQSPDAQLGIGLLAAGGPTTDPNQTGFGQRLAAGLQYVDAKRAQELRNKLVQSQVDENTSQAAMRAQQLALAQRQMAIQNQLLGYGDQPTASPSSTAAASGIMPTTPQAAGAAPTIPNGSGATVAGMPSAPPQQSTLDSLSAQYKIPPEALKYDLVFNGGKGIADLIAKRGMPDMQVTNGYVYDKNKVQPGYLPSLTTSQDGKTSMVQIGPDGLPIVSAPRGAIETATDYARAQAGLKPIKVYNPVTHREEYTNEAAVATGQGNGTAPVSAPAGLPQPYLNAVVATESGGNPNAVSPKGAQGTMQVMPGTASNPGLGVTPARDNSQQELARVGTDYLQALNQKYKDPTIAAIAYNWGPGNTDMWLKSGGDFSKLPAETKNYVASVMTRTAVNGLQPQGGNYAAGPSASEKAAQDAAAKFQSEGMTSANNYRDALNERVQQGSDLNMRLQESVKALQLFQTGGGKETRAQVAQIAQALNMPDKVVNGIAGGDLGAMQEFNKLAVQQAMEQLKQSMGGAGRIAQAEFKVFQANNPNLDTDPNAVRKIFDFNTKVFNRDLAEQKEMTSYLQGGGDPSQWRPIWSQRQQQLGYINPSLNAQRDAVPQQQTQTQASGKSFKDFGYATPADAIKDAQNAMMKNPAAKGEILKRLQAMGVQMPVAQGSW